MFSRSQWEEVFLVSDIFFLGGLVLIGVATVGRLWCVLYISGYKTQKLVRDGPYSMCRNPLYFFSLLGGIGVGLATETLTVTAAIGVGFLAYYPFVICAEEEKLRGIHGDAYDEYVRETPRFFPSLRPLSEPEGYTVRPRVFRRGVFDALWFVWIAGLVELVEGFHEHNLIPVLFRLY